MKSDTAHDEDFAQNVTFGSKYLKLYVSQKLVQFLYLNYTQIGTILNLRSCKLMFFILFRKL